MDLLQHYGAPSGLLDVSYDPNIALWFACHRYIRPDPTGPAYYEPNEGVGVVYVMDVPSDRLIDLRQGRELPIAGLRGWQQKGGLVQGATADRPDLSDLVIRKIAVTPETFVPEHPALSSLTQRYLFPPPEDDVFYGVLLEAKKSQEPDIKRLADYIVPYIWP